MGKLLDFGQHTRIKLKRPIAVASKFEMSVFVGTWCRRLKRASQCIGGQTIERGRIQKAKIIGAGIACASCEIDSRSSPVRSRGSSGE